MPAPRRVRIIVNPIAGSGTAPGRARQVKEQLVRSGCEVDLQTTDAVGRAEDMARSAVRDSVDVVLVCGGDGTINEAVQGLAGSETALAVMPLGTANVLGHELKLGSAPRRVAELVLCGRRRRLDLGRAAGRYFICMASAGFDAYVTEHMAKRRRGSISYLSYVAPAWRALRNYPFEPLRVRVDGRPLDRPVYHLIVGNVRCYGGPFTMTPNAKPDDGRLDAVAFCAPGHAMLALYMAATTLRVHHRLGSVQCLRATRFDVESDRPVSVQLDGDFRDSTPVSFEVVPQAITVLENRRG
jgi:YegS/Rv2252/BmrU family lipid kinase